jgi:hypothetical protein
MPMLRQVTVLARRYDIPVQVAVEEAMACGTGVCMTCVLPVTGSDGVTRMTRSCVGGPVFRGEQVRWDDIGTIPFDAFGAPGWEQRPRRATQTGTGTASGDGTGSADGGAGRGADDPDDAATADRAAANGQPKARPVKAAAKAAGARGRAARRQGHAG